MLKYAAALAVLFAVTSPASATTGIASYYGGTDHLCGRPMANGQRLNCSRGVHTVAHRTLPMGTKVRITYGDKSVVATVTDRGPAKWTGRILDLSLGTALDLGMKSTARVEYAVLGRDDVQESTRIPHNEDGSPSLFERLFAPDGVHEQERDRGSRRVHNRARHRRHR